MTENSLRRQLCGLRFISVTAVAGSIINMLF